MYDNKKKIILCDIETITDPNTLNIIYKIANARIIIASKNLVGVQTQQLAQLQNMIFNYSLEVDRMFYKDQKYLFMENKLYSIQSLAPAKLNKDCKLNISILNDANLKTAIKEWIDEHLF